MRAAAGKTVCLRIRESNGSTVIGGPTVCVTTTGAWQQTPTVSYTPTAAGNQLEVYASFQSPAAGDSFDIDGVTLFGP